MPPLDAEVLAGAASSASDSSVSEESRAPLSQPKINARGELEKLSQEAHSRLATSGPDSALRYNEAFDGSGALRPAYQAFMERTGIDPLHPKESMIQRLSAGHPLGDKIKVLPAPLILSRKEYVSKVQAGATQRLRALMSFFVDLVFLRGALIFNEKLRREYSIPKELTQELVRSIFLDDGFHLDGVRRAGSKRSVEDVNVFYGPDIV